MKFGVSQLKSPWSTLSYLSYLEAGQKGSCKLCTGSLLVKAEISETDKALFLCFPYTVDNILYSNAEICLTVPCVSERHERWFCLRYRCKCQMWWPVLYDNHVASEQTSRIGPASRIGLTPEDDTSVCIVRVSQYIM